MLGVGLGERQRQRVQRGLRHLVAERRVAPSARRPRTTSGDRGDERDRAAAALAHRRQRGLGHQQRAARVDAHDPLPGCEVDPLGPAVALADPDVVVEHVEAPEALGAGRDRGGAVLLARDVALEHLGRAALGGDRRGGVRGRCAVAVEQHHARALACEQQRGGAAVADLLARGLAGACDQRDLAGEAPGHYAPSARAITICCTSSVPSPIVRILASR